MDKIKLSSLLNIKKGVVSVIGGGGKTTMLKVLANELLLKGTVILTTSTKIYPFPNYENITNENKVTISKALKNNRIICVAKNYDNKKLTAPDISFEELSDMADYVLVEADGSKGLPIKAHLNFEPVIPKNTAKTISVVGISGLNKLIKESVHRCERFAEINSVSIEKTVNEAMIANTLNFENLHDIVFINQADNDELLKKAENICRKLNKPSFYGSLKKGEWYVMCN